MSDTSSEFQGQIDGNIVSAQFILLPRKKQSPPRAISSPKKEGLREHIPRDLPKDALHRRDCEFAKPMCPLNLLKMDFFTSFS